MAITKARKTEILETVRDVLKNSASVVFVNFHGLSVRDVGDLRASLGESGSRYIVVKKTLAKKAFAEMKLKGEEPTLEGELALAFGEDAILPAKSVAEFQKKHAEQLKILGGIFERGYLTPLEVAVLAAIPSREALLGQLVRTLNAPIQGTVSVLGAVLGGFVRVLDARAKSLN
jgi:large subunit ribosomal protein L10